MKIHNSNGQSFTKSSSLLTEIKHNKKSTIQLMVGLSAFLLVLLWIILICIRMFDGEHLSLYTAIMDAVPIIVWAGIGSAIYLWINYRHAAKHLMQINQATEVSPDQLSQMPLGNIIDEVVAAAGIPKPRVYLIEDPTMNAFATGCDPKHGQLAFTTGLLENMTPLEIKAVVGHEIGHIRNYDIRVNTVAMGITSLIGGTGMILIRLGVRFLQLSTTERRNKSKDADQSSILIGFGLMAMGGIILLIGLPITKVIQAAVSRQRESLADVTSADITRDPINMINALKRLQGDTTPSQVLNQSVSAMFIADAGDGKRHWYHNLLATHPPLDERIERLEKLLR